jgi:hypothetical protein
MKNLRKVFAVILVVCMAFSLMAVASAADISSYSDSSSITEKEAVNVLTYAGVLQGSGGAFDPTGTFTREQAAKIVAYLMVGSAAGQLTTTTSTFKDVEVTRWSAGVIQYCASKGVVGGDGTGNFNPTASVTAAQFAKMLLTGLGYGKQGEYTGTNWAINSISDAVGLKILTLNVDYNQPATREQVAKYALNALTQTSVTYSTSDNMYKLVYDNYYAGKLNLTKAKDQVVNGVTGHTWTLAPAALYFAFYPDETILATSTNGFGIATLSDPTSLFYKATTAVGFTMFVNGVQLTAIKAGDALVKDSYYYAPTGDYVVCTTAGLYGTTAVTANALKAGDTVNFVDTTPNDGLSLANKVAITRQTVDVIGPSGVSTANGITTVNMNGATVTKQSTYVTGTDGLVYKDVVTYYTDVYGIVHFTKCTPVEGKYVGFNSLGTSVRVGDKDYTLNTEPGASPFVAGANTYGGLNVGSSVTVYLDANGYAAFVTGTPVPVTTNMAVVLAFGDVPANATGPASVEAKLLMPDGTTKVVKCAQAVSVLIGATVLDSTLAAGTVADTDGRSDVISQPIVSYAIGADGKYTFTSQQDAAFTANIANLYTNTAMFDNANVASTTTIFLVNNKDGTYSSYVGIDKVPAFTVADYSFSKTNGVCSLVYIQDYTTTSLNSKVVYFYSTMAAYTAPTTVGGVDDYYTYSAVVGTTGVQTTVKTTTGVAAIINAAGGLVTDAAQGPGLYSVTYDTLGRISGATKLTATNLDSSYYSTGSIAPLAGLVGFGPTAVGAKYYSYAADAPVYIYNPTTLALSTTTVAGVITDDNDAVFATMNPTTHQVTGIYVYKVAPSGPVTPPVLPTNDLAAAVVSAGTRVFNTTTNTLAISAATGDVPFDLTFTRDNTDQVITITGTDSAWFTTADNLTFSWNLNVAGHYTFTVTVTEPDCTPITYTGTLIIS